MDQLPELVPFLLEPKSEIKLLALQHLLGVSDNQEARDILKSTQIINNCIKLITDSNHVVVRHALTILINLCQDTDMLNDIVKKNIVPRLVDGTTDTKNKMSEIFAMLLSNVTHTKEGCLSLMQCGKELEAFFIMKLVQVLTMDSNQEDYFKSTKNNWIVNIILNVTQIQEGRKIVLDKENQIFKEILPLVRHENVIKRRGILGIIRNCCYSEQHHDYLISPEVDILTKLCLPIRGNDKLDDDDLVGLHIDLHNSSLPIGNERDQDRECRKMVVESLIFLTGTKKGRVSMRTAKIYPILRNLFNFETEEELRDNVEKVVELIIRDEEGDPTPEEIEQMNKKQKLEDEDAQFETDEI
ncbi:armadillo-like helical domain-containing protein [Dictyostelium discoideum AX4]|uniref:Co-chaperone protein HGH1 homolog n=1 Tax=Dictyostelium discoideum TaxID=44689 RepID=HGH1_DICDI|nr:armadillo-like helical domain-containing protein [Dictyostelium discoideum AX4]Q76NW7.1 RecName: Full=Protein HGH1 homolog [Dictyostelium discoideum]EAL68932.1 armadillo-like helical domain-containing protein [Dictyostelium discoideum AX4]|eukprot:XP_642954.1 armadillo-like helical domain-containing protein [Dictyostelium discoideum AX4]